MYKFAHLFNFDKAEKLYLYWGRLTVQNGRCSVLNNVYRIFGYCMCAS